MKVYEVSKEQTLTRIKMLANLLTAKYGFTDDDIEATRTVFYATEGNKFVKIIRRYVHNTSQSVYAFVDKETGEIFKAASWNTPAKHSRGNVNNSDNGIGCCERYSVVYLKEFTNGL